jgi:hypothetical protein
MPPRHAYWTILVGNAPTAFRAHDRADLLPTLERLRATQPDAVMRWFARGRLWDSPEQARAEQAPRQIDPRNRDWRPGGTHRDPRDRFKPKRRDDRRGPPRDQSTQDRREKQDRSAGPPRDRTSPPRDRGNNPPGDRRFGPPRDRSTGPPRDRSFGPPRDRSTGPPRDRGFGTPQDRSAGPPRDRSFDPKKPGGWRKPPGGQRSKPPQAGERSREGGFTKPAGKSDRFRERGPRSDSPESKPQPKSSPFRSDRAPRPNRPDRPGRSDRPFNRKPPKR